MKRHWQVLGVVVLVSLVVSSVLTGCGALPESFSPAPVPEGSYAAVSNPVASPAADKGPGEAIRVHGRWTIEVRNPDGTVAEVREFENALTNVGDMVLSQVMGRGRSVGGWTIALAGNPTAFQTSAGVNSGFILENGGMFAGSGPGFFPTLTIDLPSTGTNADKLVLSGTAIAQFDGVIGVVSTQVTTRPSSEAPSSTYGGGAVFTSTDLAAPITLTAGQQVLVTVVISFS